VELGLVGDLAGERRPAFSALEAHGPEGRLESIAHARVSIGGALAIQPIVRDVWRGWQIM
jgi:hypothetical protein